MRMFRKILLASVVVIVIITINAGNAHATSVSGTLWPNGGTGSISNIDCGGPDTSWYGNDMFSGRNENCGGSALGGLNSKSKFINYISSKYNPSSESGESLSAHYVVSKMLGSDNLSEWESRMNGADIQFRTTTIGSAAYTTTFYAYNGGNSQILEAGNGGGNVIEIYSGNAGGAHVTYAYIEISCGNMLVGPFPKLPSSWTINGQSYVKETNSVSNSSDFDSHSVIAYPGQVLHFKHDLRAISGNASVHWVIRGSGFDNFGPPDGTLQSGDAIGNEGDLFLRANDFNQTKNATSAYMTYGPLNENDVGNKYCQRIEWAPGSSNNGNPESSDWACADMPYEFTLKPSVSASSSEVDAGGTIGNVSGSVQNISGRTKSFSDTQWYLTEIIVSPSDDVPNADGGESSSGQCSYYGISNGNYCKNLDIGNHTGSIMPGGDKTFSVSNVTAPDNATAGTKICFSVSVKERSNSDSNWQYSPTSCNIVGKKPKIHITGGDLSVGRYYTSSTSTNVDTITSEKDGKIYGSWEEYAMYVAGSVKGMASGDYLNGGSSYSGTTTDQCNLSPLTFSNLTPLSGNKSISGASCQDSSLGGYSLSTTTPNVRSNFLSLSENNNLPNTDLSSVQSGVYSSGSVNLTSSSTIPDNRSIIIISSGTVTIDSDLITKLDNVSSIDQISQIIIVANEIDIKSNVQRVDAWLVAKTYDSNNNTTEKGILNTCYDPSDNIISDSSSIAHLNSDVCNKQLTINGPVAADKIFFYRTYGSDADSESESAETFNLPASTFLWSKALEKGADSTVTTVYQTERPVRY